MNLILLVVHSLALATGVFNKVEVEDRNGVFVHVVGERLIAPKMSLEQNYLQFTFEDAALAPQIGGRLDLDSPHVLVKRLSVYESDGRVKVGMLLQGTLDSLKERLTVEPQAKGWGIRIASPKSSPLIKILEEEQQTLASAIPEKKSQGYSSWVSLFFLIVGVVALCGGLWIIRKIRGKKSPLGSRKHLIEQMSYLPVGVKSAIGVYKIGNEFVLIGISPTQINFLTRLEKMEQQYEGESSLEREAFRYAVDGEMRRIFNRANT